MSHHANKICSQTQIGGNMCVEWMNLQERCAQRISKKDAQQIGESNKGYMGSSNREECFLHNVVEVWEPCSQHVHDKNKTEK